LQRGWGTRRPPDRPPLHRGGAKTRHKQSWRRCLCKAREAPRAASRQHRNTLSESTREASIHLINNIHLIEDLTHIGLLHYDVLFNENSINDIIESIDKDENQIFYQRIRYVDDLYLSPTHLIGICEFMNSKLNMKISPEDIWNNGWISEALSVTPIEVFKKFGNFIIDNRTEIEDILLKNRWGIMDHINHRICGIIERMWGIYLKSYGFPLVKMNIEHDWNSYIHKHQTEENWIKK
jgi:hypothetical protein